MFVSESGRNEQSLQRTFHRSFLSSFGSFGQAVSEEKIFKNLPFRNKNCPWQPCFLMDRDEMSKRFRGPSIDASYQVSVHLAKGFQRRLKCEKLTDDRRQTMNDGRRTPGDGKISHFLWQGELKNVTRTIPSYVVKLQVVLLCIHNFFISLLLIGVCCVVTTCAEIKSI